MRWRPVQQAWQLSMVAVAVAALAGVVVLAPSLTSTTEVARCDSDHARAVVRTYFLESQGREAMVTLTDIAQVAATPSGNKVTTRECRATVQLDARQIPVRYTVGLGQAGTSTVHVRDPALVDGGSRSNGE